MNSGSRSCVVARGARCPAGSSPRRAASGALRAACSTMRVELLARSPSRASRRPRRARTSRRAAGRACRGAGDRARGPASRRRSARRLRARRPACPSARRRRRPRPACRGACRVARARARPAARARASGTRTSACGLREARRDEPVDERQAERGRLAGAGARLDDEVLARGRRLEDRELHRRRVARSRARRWRADVRRRAGSRRTSGGRGRFVVVHGRSRLGSARNATEVASAKSRRSGPISRASLLRASRSRPRRRRKSAAHASRLRALARAGLFGGSGVVPLGREAVVEGCSCPRLGGGVVLAGSRGGACARRMGAGPLESRLERAAAARRTRPRRASPAGRAPAPPRTPPSVTCQVDRTMNASATTSTRPAAIARRAAASQLAALMKRPYRAVRPAGAT